MDFTMGMLPGVGAALKDIQIPEEELNKALDPIAMTRPGGEGSAGG